MEHMGLTIGQEILWFAGILGVWLLVSYLKMRVFREKKSKAPVMTVPATFLSKEVKPGTYRAGRSVMGFSFLVNFATEDGVKLELFAYEEEFGALEEGTRGLLTYQDRYFLAFKDEKT